jgi:hypothetical protein
LTVEIKLDIKRKNHWQKCPQIHGFAWDRRGLHNMEICALKKTGKKLMGLFPVSQNIIL